MELREERNVIAKAIEDFEQGKILGLYKDDLGWTVVTWPGPMRVVTPELGAKPTHLLSCDQHDIWVDREGSPYVMMFSEPWLLPIEGRAEYADSVAHWAALHLDDMPDDESVPFDQRDGLLWLWLHQPGREALRDLVIDRMRCHWTMIGENSGVSEAAEIELAAAMTRSEVDQLWSDHSADVELQRMLASANAA